VKIKELSFGKKEKFKVGDLVFWTKINEKMTGIVENLYSRPMGGRSVDFASVYEFSRQIKFEILCMNLKLLRKSDVDKTEN